MSRSEINQQTAKATLTQMLNVVFQRMEADSVYVEVRPIVVTDVLGLPRTSPQDTNSLSAVVQAFLNNVVMVTAGMQANTEDVRSSVSAAVMDARPPAGMGLVPAVPGVRVASTGDLNPVPLPSPSAASATSIEIFKPSHSGIDLVEEGNAALAAASATAASGGSVTSVAPGSATGGDAGDGGDSAPFVADAASRTAVLQRDAFLVFRALCKLSIRTNDSATANDPTSVRGKVLALELVKVLLENSGPVFRRQDKFLAAIRQYLCLSLLKNSASPLPAAQTLSVSIFMSLLTRFRTSLKAEVGVFFPMIMLKPFEGAGPAAVAPGAPPQPAAPLSPAVVQHRAVVLRCVRELCRDGQLLLDLFVNFDCDLESSNLFERLVNSLVRQAQQPVQSTPSGLGGLGGDSSSAQAAAEQGLRQDALQCLVNAIEAIWSWYRLPGEAQKIDRLMEKFAERYVKCNPGSFKSADVAYVLAYSVIMLNTDAHNPQVKNKMSKAAFLKNNRGINDGGDLPEDFMSALYDRIVSNGIKMKDDGAPGTGAAAPQEAGGLAAPARALFNTLLGLMGGRGQAVSSGPSDAAIRATLDYLHQRAASATTVSVTEPDAVRPLMEVIWAPLLGALSTLYDEYSDVKLVTVCLGGFLAAACLSAQTGMTHLRDVFLNALCNFTHLHSPATMRYKNALAFKYVLRVAETVGDHLQERWVDVLRCISRWELLQQIASGMPTDAALFRPPEDTRGSIKAAAAALGAKLRTVASELQPLPESFFHSSSAIAATALAAAQQSAAIISRQSVPSSALSMGGAPSSVAVVSSSAALVVHEEASIKKVHIGGSAMFSQGSRGGAHHHPHHHHHPGAPVDPSAVPAEVINSVDSGDLNRVFLTSGQLNSEAIVEFVKALTAVSRDELRDARAPRVFSLTKIVEVAHFNMTRIRLVWSRIWAVLSEYFIAVGCHANLSLAMYAVDALRQLAMKFLERDELANYTFQNDFLRPFVVVMRQSQAVEIRELIIRCLSQMILARVTNVKSGWKSMFMVFTTAANDRDPMIVRLAFDTIEKIVREHFTHITETETTTFTDCVNCLIAFTNNPHSLDVALNSIAFLRWEDYLSPLDG
ncbi:hypothetical protein Vretimale_18795 [Volvox reticuliferus]|uniref:SEC7 domain-containing protein n=1 Tax=Volvox reticuliferus TaxID=1737510 RepID=A0A8J4GZ60_9CHLO|nr:hypothetical protein Vretimale_18795 [Volvox reticuliferus]